MHVILPSRWSLIRRQTTEIVYAISLHFWSSARFLQMQLHLNWPLWTNLWTISVFSGSVTPELMKFLFGRTIISRENVQMSALYKTHLDATIHWCNLPAHFWRTNYCALVKQTIWNASPLNRSCWGIHASSSLHTAFVLLLIVLSHICLLSGLKAHQRRWKRLKVGDVFCDYIPGLRVKKLGTQNATSVLEWFASQLFEQLYGRRMCPDSVVYYQRTCNSSSQKHQAGCVQITPPADFSFWHLIDLKRML